MLGFLSYLLIRALIGMIGRLPRATGYLVCESLALLAYKFDRKHREIGLKNLEIAFPEQDREWRENVLRKSFKQLGTHAAEISWFFRMDEEELRGILAYEPGYGLEHYLQARNSGKGIVFLTAHISAWELLPAGHAVLGHPLSFVVRPLNNRYLDRWITRMRSRFGNRVLAKQGSVRQILRILKKGEDVGLLIDQNVQEKDGAYVPLFGKLACTTTAAAAVALKTDAAVIPGFLQPDVEKGKYLIRFYPAVDLIRTGDRENDLVANTAKFNEYVEEVIRRNPHCWLWGHRRFRTQPDGSEIYG
jgi:KDO2-lipid IV(A) lauroyltransferase